MLTKQYLEDRIERVPESGCWIWMRAVMPKGYGQYGDGKRHGYAHRLAWELYRGSIPKGAHVLHHCDVPCCVNPAHLYLGTNLDNINDKVRRGRSLRGIRHNMVKLTEEQVREILQTTPRTHTETELAAKHGVSRSLIGYIRRRELWTHLDPVG